MRHTCALVLIAALIAVPCRSGGRARSYNGESVNRPRTQAKMLRNGLHSSYRPI